MTHKYLFSPKNKEAIDNFLKLIKSEINKSKTFDHLSFTLSPRIIGDSIQEVIENIFRNKLPENIGVSVDEKFARRSMADVAFTDIYNNYCIVDIKTHNINTEFNMPNLTSVRRLADLYMDNENVFSILVVNYEIVNENIKIIDIVFEAIEHFNWDCLTIGALGWGQIQISNSNIINTDVSLTRKQWMINLCDILSIFYPKEISKINDRITYFDKIKQHWEGVE